MFTNEAISGGITLQTMRYSPIMNRPLGEPILWSISACHGPFWWARRCYLGNPSYSSPRIYGHQSQHASIISAKTSCRFADTPTWPKGANSIDDILRKNRQLAVLPRGLQLDDRHHLLHRFFFQHLLYPQDGDQTLMLSRNRWMKGRGTKMRCGEGVHLPLWPLCVLSEAAGICWYLLSKKSTCDRSIGQLTEKEHLQWVSPSNVCWFTSPVK